MKKLSQENRGHFLSCRVRPSFDIAVFVLMALAISIASTGRDLFWIPWIGFVPAFCVLYRSSFSRAFIFGAIAGVIKCITLWFWVITVTKYMLKAMFAGIIFLTALSLFYAFFFGLLYSLICCIIQAFKNKKSLMSALWMALATASLWVTFEFGYGIMLVLTGQIMPLGVSYSQWNHPAILQIASITGHYGISFLIVLFNIAVTDDLYRKRFLLSPFAGALVLVCVCAGYLRIHTAALPPYDTGIRVSILQGNIPPYDKFDRQKANFIAHRYLELGQLANRAKPQLIIWTEAAIPWPLQEDDDLMTTMLRVTAPSEAYHILGTTLAIADETNTYYNTVLFIHPDGKITAQYNKRHLLTFVEKNVHLPIIMPASGSIHPAQRKYQAGTLPPVLNSPLGRIGIMVCNESLYPTAARQSALAGGRFIVLLANDAWFREDVPVDCHFIVTLLRAVETGRDLVIANNIGNSAIIDAFGRILTRSDKRVHSCTGGIINKRADKTLYVRLGDLFATTCLCFAFCTIIYACIHYRRLIYYRNKTS